MSGDAAAEPRYELRVLNDDGTLGLMFKDGMIGRFRIEDGGAHVTYMRGELLIEGSFPLAVLRRSARIEFDLAGESAGRRLFHGALDYIETAAEAGRTKVSFEARGPAAALVDRRFTGEVGPTLSNVVARLAEDVHLRAQVDYPETSLSAWVNADSSYGALRLLATSLGGIVRTKDDVVELISADRYLERMNAKPAAMLTSAQIESSRSVQGRPVRQ